MLKLNYTDVGLYMERVIASVEMVIAQRVMLAMRLSGALCVQPGRASFLLPANLPDLEQLEIALQSESNAVATVIPVDDAFVEISLTGSWIAESKESHEGMFLVLMGDRTEFLIYKLWQMSEVHISSLA